MDISNTHINIPGSILVIAVTIGLLVFIKRVLIKQVAYKDLKNHKNTALGLLFNILQYVVGVTGIFVFMSINGINITGVLAGLGIFATIVGLSLQDTFKDLFAGLNIYDNNFYKVGDYVNYNGEICQVKFFNARVTKFQAFFTGNTYTVSNNLITSIEKVKKNSVVMFNFDYDVDKELIDDSLNNVLEAIKKDPLCKNAEYLGLLEIDIACVKYGLLITADPIDQIFVKMHIHQLAYDEFKAHQIAPQFDSDRDVVISDKEKGLRRTKELKERAKKKLRKTNKKKS